MSLRIAVSRLKQLSQRKAFVIHSLPALCLSTSRQVSNSYSQLHRLQNQNPHWNGFSSSRPVDSRCVSTSNSPEVHDPPTESKTTEDRVAWVLRMEHIALIANIERQTLTIDYQLARNALKLFFAHDERSRRLLKRWEQVARDFLDIRREYRELNNILANALERYNSDSDSREEIIVIKAGEDPVLVALRLYGLRESIIHIMGIIERLFLETAK
ncbi:hypothetical protein GGU10DRAFT_388470 [Lentinula aff. detonsa]|uniref:Uncharacterized protein n=1 Tax=Lentinula aff. detonsa TaxID=2804958 RepID=A0AA38KYV7_9AGAR|nr:hypothetical protein GGU10DRAFT_388470 [Lentinula aff. detonsa]